MESDLSFDDVLVDEDSSAALATSCEDVNKDSEVVSAVLLRRKDRRLLVTMPLSLLLLSSSMEVEVVADNSDDDDDARKWRIRESCTKGEGAKALHDESDDSMATSSNEA